MRYATGPAPSRRHSTAEYIHQCNGPAAIGGDSMDFVALRMLTRDRAKCHSIDLLLRRVGLTGRSSGEVTFRHVEFHAWCDLNSELLVRDLRAPGNGLALG